jgi:hypothetical protein
MVSKAKQKSRKKTSSVVRLEKLAALADAHFLKEFNRRCIKRFDVTWVCDALTGDDTIPPWYKTILTRMLVGWIVCPKRPRVRKALAWHHINRIAHKKALKSQNAKTPYTIAALANFFAMFLHRYKHIYGPLGGFDSITQYSLFEITSWSKENAQRGKFCLQFVDILNHQASKPSQTQFTPNFDHAKIWMDQFNDVVMRIQKPKKFHDLKKHDGFSDYGIAPNKIFDAQTQYAEKQIGRKEFEVYWKSCKQSAEFIAALYCIEIDAAKLYPSARANLKPAKRVNALDAIIQGSIERLPFSSQRFQTEVVQRAKFFSTLLTTRRKVRHEFPPELPGMRSDLAIFAKETLRKLDDMHGSTKRSVS